MDFFEFLYVNWYLFLKLEMEIEFRIIYNNVIKVVII